MTEFELKLEVPPERREEVVVAFGQARRMRLLARYFDTATGDLARAGVVVRVRKEGGRWVQTAKAGSGRTLERLEHNVALRPGAGLTPAVDLARHAGTPVEGRIRKALGLGKEEAFPGLLAVFETDVQRQTLVVQAGRSEIEIAFDRGRVVAGEANAPLCELEFELKSGRPQDAIDLARRWCTRHRLWLSSISKSAKGRRLAQGQAYATAGAQPARFDPEAPAAQVLAAMVHSGLEQVLANASDVAAGSTDHEQIHQLRVGLRRLRCVLRDVEVPGRAIDPEWETELARAFRVLGTHRDHDLLSGQQQPLLEAAGGPALNVEAADKPADLVQALRAPGLQRTLLGLLAFAYRPPTAAPGPSAKAIVRARLKKLHRKAMKQGRGFLSLEEQEQHSVRKQVKRLRYLAELAAPLFGESRVQRFLKRLKPVQDSLGHYNDGLMALHQYRELARTEPRAWFGVGWLSAARAGNAAACQRDLDALRKQKTFW